MVSTVSLLSGCDVQAVVLFLSCRSMLITCSRSGLEPRSWEVLFRVPPSLRGDLAGLPCWHQSSPPCRTVPPSEQDPEERYFQRYSWLTWLKACGTSPRQILLLQEYVTFMIVGLFCFAMLNLAIHNLSDCSLVLLCKAQFGNSSQARFQRGYSEPCTTLL